MFKNELMTIIILKKMNLTQHCVYFKSNNEDFFKEIFCNGGIYYVEMQKDLMDIDSMEKFYVNYNFFGSDLILEKNGGKQKLYRVKKFKLNITFKPIEISFDQCHYLYNKERIDACYNYITTIENESDYDFHFYRIDDTERDIENVNIVKVLSDKNSNSINYLIKQIPKTNPNYYGEAKKFIEQETEISKNSVLVGCKKEVDGIVVHHNFLVDENYAGNKISDIISNNIYDVSEN